MLNTPLVSVLVPLYNHEKYIEECLNSIKDEGYSNIELVIHDDCSTDQSFEVAKAWISNNKGVFTKTKIERAKANRGVVGSLNRLIKLSQGEYLVVPLASDDALLPGGIQARLEALDARPDWLAVFGDARAINDKSEELTDSYLFHHFRSIKKNLLSDTKRRMEMIFRWSVPGPVILFRRQAFDPEQGVGPYNESLYLEDRDMYLRLLHNKQLGFIDRAVARYRLHSNNAMSAADKRVANIDARATPLLQASTEPSLDKWERVVCKALANALISHKKRQLSHHPGPRTGYALLKIIYKSYAKLIASLYLRLK